jgi:hypothetical protein
VIAKTFEIRDKGTFIPALAIQLEPGCEADCYLLSRAGFGEHAAVQREYVLLAKIDGGSGKAICDPYDWGAARTMCVAHDYIIRHWSELASGALVDVEFILGETKSPKLSEAVTT